MPRNESEVPRHVINIHIKLGKNSNPDIIRPDNQMQLHEVRLDAGMDESIWRTVYDFWHFTSGNRSERRLQAMGETKPIYGVTNRRLKELI